MQTPEDKKLEEFIHRQLKKLPERQAPEALIGNVLASLAARGELPWYKKPWSDWPRLNQNVFLAALVALLAGLVWAALLYTPQVPLTNVSENARAVSWMGDIASRFLQSAILVARSLKYEWILGAIGGLVLCYFWCLAAGVALFRLLTQRRFTV